MFSFGSTKQFAFDSIYYSAYDFPGIKIAIFLGEAVSGIFLGAGMPSAEHTGKPRQARSDNEYLAQCLIVGAGRCASLTAIAGAAARP